MSEHENRTAIVDAEVVPDEQSHSEAVSTALAPRERRSEVLKPLDLDQLVGSMVAYQETLKKLLDDNDYQPAEDGKKFVKKSGWRKIATAFDLDVTLIRSSVERDSEGAPLRAEVWARAVAPSGRMSDGDGYCSVDERRFARAGGRQKLENDLRATATTRAMNRAISGLVGMGAVSAEEVDAPQPGLPFGAEGSAKQVDQARNALAFLLGDPPESQAVTDAVERIRQDAGYLPRISLLAVIRAAQAVKTMHDARDAEVAEEVTP